jgi:LCP family protein required for cell wall assembly
VYGVMSGQPPDQQKPRRSALYRVVVTVLVFGFFVTTLVAGVAAYVTARDLSTNWTGVGFNPFQPFVGPTQVGAATPALGESTAPPPPSATPIPWNGSERVTILVLGLDYRDWVAGSGAPRSDSMMLITLDPITMKAGMLSIPRDLWVDIPGFTHNRINAAYAFGEGYRVPGGGPALAMQTVESVIGVPITYYMVVDFATFERMIDEIGGIDVLVTQRIKISPIGRLSHWLDAKAYHLDGADALAYARVRKGAGDDFGRAQRQQQVALAILDRVVGFDMLPTLVTKAPALYQELSSGIRTNLSLDDMIALSWLAIRVNKDDIVSGVISPPKMVGFYTRPDGASVLRPIPDQIRILRDTIFTDTSALGPDIGSLVPATPSP